MNYHSDEWIMARLFEHYNDAVEYFPRDRIVCLNLAGSQNYGLDTEGSDVDTKLVIVPSFRDVAMEKIPTSTTHVRPNNEHIEFKDVRYYIPILRKGNINFLETLFSKYTIVNPFYANEWYRLVGAREEIARYDVARAIQAMRGNVYSTYKRIFNATDNRVEAIEKFGYSPKDFYIIQRIEEFIKRYIAGEPYADCLVSKKDEYFKSVKNGCFTAGDVQWMAKVCFDRTLELCDKFLETCDKTVNQEVSALMDDVQYNIMKLAMKKELGE
jgi:hypothetical protein